MSTSAILSSPHRMKLGTFGTNVESGPTLTTIPTRLRTDWDIVRRLAIKADGMGLDAIVPVARWKGHGGIHNTHGSSFDTFAWAAGVGSVTERAQIFTTCHMGSLHPIAAAKQLVTVDHITGGRAAINTVGGWRHHEMQMFGGSLLPHEARYDHAEEWTELLIRLWTETGPFDFEGTYVKAFGAESMPKPIQRPRPPIMNAGGSDRGRDYAAKYADMAFVVLHGDDPVAHRAQVSSIKDFARDQYSREVQVWSAAYLVCRETEAEADAYLRWYANEYGDMEAANAALSAMSAESGVLGEQQWQEMRRGFIAGSGGVPLVGTPEMIADRLHAMSEAGIDGCLLICAEWDRELDILSQDLMPVLVEAGLRSA